MGTRENSRVLFGEHSCLCLDWILAFRRANQKFRVDLQGHADVTDRHRVQMPHRRGRFAAKARNEDVGIQEPDHVRDLGNLIEIGHGTAGTPGGSNEAVVVRE